MAQVTYKIPVPTDEIVDGWTDINDVREYLVKALGLDMDKADEAVFQVLVRYFNTQISAQTTRRKLAEQNRALIAAAKAAGIKV